MTTSTALAAAVPLTNQAVNEPELFAQGAALKIAIDQNSARSGSGESVGEVCRTSRFASIWHCTHYEDRLRRENLAPKRGANVAQSKLRLMRYVEFLARNSSVSHRDKRVD